MEDTESLILHLRKFFPAAAYERISSSRADPFELNEKRHAAIMFADICGFTALSENLSAEELSRMLSTIFAALGAKVEKYKGLIDKFLGDCILCVFGLMDGSEPEKDAGMCALEMMDALSEVNTQLEADYGITLQLSIGINSGEIFIGNIGYSERLEFTVIGDTVNTASRIQHEAGPGQIFLSESVRRRVSAAFILEAVGERKLKNKRESVRVFSLEGLAKQRASDPGREPLGREGELALLFGLLEKNSESSRGILIHGDAGIGKTHLLRYFCRKAEEDADVAAIHLQGDKFHAENSCYALRRYLSDQGGEGQVGPQFLQNKDLVRVSFYENIQVILGAKRVLALIMEDADYIDPDSLEIIAGLALVFTDGAVVIIASQRESLPRLASLEWRIRLEGLDAGAVAGLCERVLGGACSESLRDYLHHASLGNPYYIQEILADLRERGGLLYSSGEYDLIKDAALALPPGLSSLILQKLERLSYREKRAMRYAALCGAAVELELLEILSGLSGTEMDAFLEKVADLNIARKGRESGKAALRFSHMRAQEVIADSILDQAQVGMHLEIAEAIMSRPQGNSDLAYHSILASHFENGGDVERAVFHYFFASEKAKLSHDISQARTFLSKAIVLARRREKSFSYGNVELRDVDLDGAFSCLYYSRELDLSLLYYLYALCFALNEEPYLESLEKALDVCEQAQGYFFFRLQSLRLNVMDYHNRITLKELETGLNEAVQDGVAAELPYLHQASLLYARLGHYVSKDPCMSLEILMACIAQFEVTYSNIEADREALGRNFNPLMANAIFLRLYILFSLSHPESEMNLEEVEDLIQSALPFILGKDDLLSYYFSVTSLCLRENSQHLCYSLRCLELAEASRNIVLKARLESMAGYDYLVQGSYAEAVEHFGRAASICLKAGFRHELAMAYYNLGLARYLQEDYLLSLEEARRSVEIKREFPSTFETADWTSVAQPLCLEAVSLFLLRRFPEAADCLASALALKPVRANTEIHDLCRFLVRALERSAEEGLDPVNYLLKSQEFVEKIEAMRESPFPIQRGLARGLAVVDRG